MRHRLLFHPDYRTANPYQTLLYAPLDPAFQVTAGDVDAALEAQRTAPFATRVVFHLHWEDAIYRNEPDEASATERAMGAVAGLEAFRDAGGVVVWTIHNASPHDGRWPEIHRRLVDSLGRLADLVLVHGRSAAAWATRERGIDPARLAIVTHGNYRAVHGEPPEGAAAARELLGLPADALVLLLFGRLGAYKGGAELLAAFAALDDPRVRLVLAGKQIDPLGAQLDEVAPATRARISVLDRFLDRGEVDRVLAAADAVVMPYRRVLCSGAMLLALGAGRPVVAPDEPALCETLQDGHNGLVYAAAGGTTALTAALARLAALEPTALAAMGEAARRTADGHDWRSTALVLSGLLRQAIAAARPVRRLA